MENDRLDNLARVLASRRGRRSLAGLAGGAVATAAGLAASPDTGAKKKKKHKRKKVRCAAGQITCPAGSHEACCDAIFPSCCPESWWALTGAVCCPSGCCRTDGDCPGSTSCSNGCCGEP